MCKSKFLPSVELLSPEENMERDLKMFCNIEEGKYEEAVRLYRWSELCISVGFSQKINSFPIKAVRRPTGGGILIHGWDISFALAGKREKWGNRPKEIYRRVAERIKEIFKKLGIKVCMEKFSGNYLMREICYWVPAFGEITYKNRKLVFMAMKTGKRAFLIHGSIYETFDYKKASEILKVPEDYLRDRVISLEEIGVSTEEFIKIFGEVFKIL